MNFQGGPACFPRNFMDGCNYLLVDCVDRCGNEVRLYAEYLEPTEDNEEVLNFIQKEYDDVKTLEDIEYISLDKTYWFDGDKFDRISYRELRAEILRQAEECDVDPETLDFSTWDAEYLD